MVEGDRVSGVVQGQAFTGTVVRVFPRGAYGRAISIRTDQELLMGEGKLTNRVIKTETDLTKI